MIDTTIFAVDIPAGTYTAGQVITMPVIYGPSVVRDGYGTAKAKQVLCFTTVNNVVDGSYIEFKNANWNDSLRTMSASMAGNNAYSALSKTSPIIQRCGDIELQPNSSFTVQFVIGSAVTTTVATTAVCMLDIDYPSVAAIANPRDEQGLPMSITRTDSITVTANGDVANLIWTTVNVDEFKAGYRYLLAQIGEYVDGTTTVGFVAFSGSPSMNGLVRVIPVIPRMSIASRLELDYSAPMVKGPMNISYAALGTAGTYTAYLECDYIRR